MDAAYYWKHDVVDIDSFSAFTFLCDKGPCSLSEFVSTFSLSLWERAGVRVLAGVRVFFVASSKAPSPGLRPASPRGRGDKAPRGADNVNSRMLPVGI
jgi:hypothetical protein